MSDRKLTLIASKGTLDWAYPPFILASTAAVGYQVTLFFPFFGLQLRRNDFILKVSPLGNQAMSMPLGMIKWFPVFGPAIPGW